MTKKLYVTKIRDLACHFKIPSERLNLSIFSLRSIFTMPLKSRALFFLAEPYAKLYHTKCNGLHAPDIFPLLVMRAMQQSDTIRKGTMCDGLNQASEWMRSMVKKAGKACTAFLCTARGELAHCSTATTK